MGRLLVAMLALLMVQVTVLSSSIKTYAAQEMDRVVQLDEACRQIEEHQKAVLCVSPDQIEALSPLAPIVYNSHYQQEKDPWDMHLYPLMFKILDAVPSDNLDERVALPECNNSIEDGFLVLEQAPNKTTIRPNDPRVTKLADHIIPASHFTDGTSDTAQDPAYNYIAEGAQLFQKCCEEGLLRAQGMESLKGLQGPALAHEWATLKASQPCNDVAEEYFHKISTQLNENPLDANHRDRANLILRLVTVHWGRPSIMAHLMLLFGCDTEESYDEFLSCTIYVDEMLLNINVFQRNVDPTGKAWECETCSLHDVSKNNSWQ